MIRLQKFNVGADSLLIHAFAYSLFIGVYSVMSNMTSYSHPCHSIKLSDKMVLCVVTHSLLFHALQFFFIKVTVYQMGWQKCISISKYFILREMLYL